MTFEPLGINATIEHIYRFMLRSPEADPPEIADRIGVGEDVVSDALDRLVDLALLEPSREHADRLRPVSPMVGLGTLLGQQQKELMARQREIEEMRAAVESLSDEYQALHPSQPGVVESLVGPDAVRTRLEEISYRARHEYLALSIGAEPEEILNISRRIDQMALGRGLTIRVVYPESVRNHPPTFKYARWLTERGGRVRTVPSLPGSLVIVDGEIAFVPLTGADAQGGAVEIGSRAIVSTLVSLFEFVWSSATSFSSTPRRDKYGWSAQERELLRLLADGHTDEAAARDLGVSLRTVRRMASSLMKRLDARSRFQAGVHAAELDLR